MTFKLNFPKTVKEAVDILDHIMTDEEKHNIKNKTHEELVDFHFGLGQAIRNEFGLWNENYELIADSKAKDADEASMVIIKALWDKLQQDGK